MYDRGGGELGTEWYEQGRRMNKMNSFYDFISCAGITHTHAHMHNTHTHTHTHTTHTHTCTTHTHLVYLIKNKYTQPSLLTAVASSAGGLLLGNKTRNTYIHTYIHTYIQT